VEEKKQIKGRIYFLLSLFSFIFALFVGVLWLHFIVHPPVAGDIVSPWFYKDYWWTIEVSSLVWLALAFYFWQKSARRGGIHF